MAHPSLLNKRGVNFALLLSFPFSSAFFRSILLHLQHVKSVSHNTRPGMHNLRFAPVVYISLIIFQTTLISSYYAIQFLFITNSLVSCSHCCPAIHLKSREPLWPHWESLPNPFIERREEWNRPGCVGELERLFPILTPPTPYPWEGRKPPPHQPSPHRPLIPFSLPAVCSHLRSS